MVLRNNRYKRSRNRRGCKSRNKKGGRKSRRVKRRKSRKSRKRKRTRRKRKRRMRGGSGCPYNKNLGEQITGRKYNNLAGPIPRERYVSTSNLKQKGGAAAQNLAQGLGFGDLWGSAYGLGNSFSNLRTWGGKAPVDSHKPRNKSCIIHLIISIPDIKAFHDGGVIKQQIQEPFNFLIKIFFIINIMNKILNQIQKLCSPARLYFILSVVFRMFIQNCQDSSSYNMVLFP